MKKFTGVVFLFLLITLLIPAQVSARSQNDDQIVLGGSFILDEDETLIGNLVVIGGIADLRNGSNVTGDIILVGCTLTANGTINGNVILVGSSANLEKSTKVLGDLISISSQIDQENGSIIKGEIRQNFGFPLQLNSPDALPSIPDRPEIFHPDFSPLMTASRIGFRSFVVSILAMLAAMIFPNAILRTGRPILSEPVLAGTIGFFASIIIPILLAITVITIIGIPITLVGALLLIYAAFLGWVSVGTLIGSRLAGAFKSQWHIAVKAGVGTLLLTLVTDAISRIACVGWVIPFLVGILGLGAVLMTRLGTRESKNTE